MTNLFLILAIGFASAANASFIDCRSADWFQLSVEFTINGAGAKYINSNEQEGYTSISNTDLEPIYLVVNGKEIFKLADSKLYKPRMVLGKALGWEKIRFTHFSDAMESDSTSDLFHLILDLENLLKFGVNESQVSVLKTRLAQCGPNRPTKMDSSLQVPIAFHLKIKEKLHKIEGKALVRLNNRYDPNQSCCK